MDMFPTNQDIIAALGPVLGAERAARLDRVAACRLGGLRVVLENLHDPHNGAAALRSCEALGLLRLEVVQGEEQFRFSSRVTQGAEKWLEIARHPSIDACAAALRRDGFALYAAVPGASVPLEAVDPLARVALVFGNEHAGLTPRALELAAGVFSLPLQGFSRSLNLSVATALAVSAQARRRRAALGRDGDLDAAELEALRARYYRLDVRGADAIIERYLRRAP